MLSMKDGRQSIFLDWTLENALEHTLILALFYDERDGQENKTNSINFGGDKAAPDLLRFTLDALTGHL